MIEIIHTVMLGERVILNPTAENTSKSTRSRSLRSTSYNIINHLDFVVSFQFTSRKPNHEGLPNRFYKAAALLWLQCLDFHRILKAIPKIFLCISTPVLDPPIRLRLQPQRNTSLQQGHHLARCQQSAWRLQASRH